MKINLLLFAHLREILKKSELEINVSGPTVAQVLNEIKEMYPEIAPMIESGRIQIAVNEEYAQPEQVLHENDSLALIPPVSGG